MVWVSEEDDHLEIYDKETGKQLIVHKLSSEKGKYILDPAHRKIHHIADEVQENGIMAYCNCDDLALAWMMNLKKSRPRYYKDNILRFSDVSSKINNMSMNS